MFKMFDEENIEDENDDDDDSESPQEYVEFTEVYSAFTSTQLRAFQVFKDVNYRERLINCTLTSLHLLAIFGVSMIPIYCIDPDLANGAFWSIFVIRKLPLNRRLVMMSELTPQL